MKTAFQLIWNTLQVGAVSVVGVINVVFPKVLCLLFYPKITINHKVFKCQYICSWQFYNVRMIYSSKANWTICFTNPCNVSISPSRSWTSSFDKLTTSCNFSSKSTELRQSTSNDSESVLLWASHETYTTFCWGWLQKSIIIRLLSNGNISWNFKFSGLIRSKWIQM